MSYDQDLQPEIDPKTNIYRFRCEICGKIFEYEDIEGSPLNRICSLCEFSQTHSDLELNELTDMITELKKYRKSDYLLIQDAIYFYNVFKCSKRE